jgi:Zn-dependent hydrolases, including glyoxylases
METYRIYPICAGMFPDIEKSNLAYQKDAGTKLREPILMYLIKGRNLCMLVDTGGCDPSWAEKYHHTLIQTEDMQPTNAVRNLGVAPEDISIIVNTHLHWDHCSNNDKFPNAKIYVQKRELQFAVNPIPTQYTYYESTEIGMTPPWTRGMDRFIIVDGDYHLCDGIDLLLTPGHTPGFQCVSVNTTDGRFLIVSDCFGIRESWSQCQTWGLPTPSGIHVNLIEYYDSIRRLFPLADEDHILCGHDVSVLEHEVYPYR